MTAIAPGFRLGTYEIVGKLEPSCGREPSESPQARSPYLRQDRRAERGISC